MAISVCACWNTARTSITESISAPAGVYRFTEELGLALRKSHSARTGELASAGSPLPARVYANEGACQFLFLKGNEPCEVSYADRAGKYMGQRGVTLPKL